MNVMLKRKSFTAKMENNKTKQPQELTPEQYEEFTLNLRKTHMFGIAIEYCALTILDWLPSSNIRNKCLTMVHAPENFLKSFRNKVGEKTYSELIRLVETDYELLAEKFPIIDKILDMNKEQFHKFVEQINKP